jgi:hypothetical protein
MRHGTLHPAVVIGCAVIVAIVVISGLVNAFTLPYGLMKLWTIRASFESLLPALPLLAITAATTAYGLWYTPSPTLRKDRANLFTFDWAWQTVAVAAVGAAGIWVILLLGAWILVFADQILGGFIGLHAIHSLQNGIVGPIADTLSLGFVTGVVNDPARWAVSLMVVAWTVFDLVTTAVRHRKEGWTPLATSAGIVTSWIAELSLIYVLLAYGVWSTMLVVLAVKLIMDVIRYAHLRNEGGVEVLPPQA